MCRGEVFLRWFVVAWAHVCAGLDCVRAPALSGWVAHVAASLLCVHAGAVPVCGVHFLAVLLFLVFIFSLLLLGGFKHLLFVVRYSTVAGGFANVASGEFSFVAGNSALAMHSESAVLSFGTDTCTSAGANTVAVCTTSGLYVLLHVYWSTSA